MMALGARCSYQVARSLRACGVDVLFGLVGHANYHLASDFVDQDGRYVAMRHEAGAVAAADAYARVTGGVGVATVTQGPGLTNTATALVEAGKAGTPVVVIAGDTSDGATDNQDIDQCTFGAALGAFTMRASSPDEAVGLTAIAVRRASTTRQPVLLSIPGAIQSGPAQAPVPYHRPTRRPTDPDAEQVVRAAKRIAAADKPLVIAGRGCLLAQAKADTTALGETLGSPLTTTAQAHGLFAGHPLDLGICGGYSREESWTVITDADTVIAVGASLSRHTTRNGELFAGVDVVHVDQRPRGQYPVHGDAARSVAALLRQLAPHSPRPAWARRPTPHGVEDLTGTDGMHPAAAAITLDAVLPRNRTVVLDSGHHPGWAARYLSVPDERSWVFAQDFQSLGLGLAGAVGAGQARTGGLVVAVVGDGGLAMSMGELDTVARAGAPTLVVVYDDAAYGAEFHRFPENADRLCVFDPIDFAGVAKAVGAKSAEARSPDEIAPALSAWLDDLRGMFLLHLRIDRTVRGPWLTRGVQYQHLHDAWLDEPRFDRQPAGRPR